MASLFTCGIASVLLGLFICFDGHTIVKDKVMVKYRNFRKVNKLVARNYSGAFTILWVSTCMVAKALWLSVWQYFNNSVIKMSGGKYEVTYIINGKIYKMIVKPKRGPRRVLMVFDENHFDISDIVFPYLGPGEDFHGRSFTPKFFDKKEIIFALSDGEEIVFTNEENMI